MKPDRYSATLREREGEREREREVISVFQKDHPSLLGRQEGKTRSHTLAPSAT
jgi:hypothetical protein